MFGVGKAPVDGMGFPWLLGTDEITKYSKPFLRESRAFVSTIRKHYTLLVNWVSGENKEAVRWLKWLGFTFETEENYLVDPDVPFYQFYMYGKELADV